jgi:hypothetical protein
LDSKVRPIALPPAALKEALRPVDESEDEHAENMVFNAAAPDSPDDVAYKACTDIEFGVFLRTINAMAEMGLFKIQNTALPYGFSLQRNIFDDLVTVFMQKGGKGRTHVRQMKTRGSSKCGG